MYYLSEGNIITLTRVNKSSSWVMMAKCFQSKYFIRATTAELILSSGGTGLTKDGYNFVSDRRGDEESMDTCCIISDYICITDIKKYININNIICT